MISYKALVITCFIMLILIIVLLLCLLRAIADRNYWENKRNEWHDLCHETQLQLEKMKQKKFEEDFHIIYKCDRKGCNGKIGCSNPECYMTTEIEHAVNFHNVTDDMWEENCLPPDLEVKEDVLDG